jgi:hypothetical protein
MRVIMLTVVECHEDLPRVAREANVIGVADIRMQSFHRGVCNGKIELLSVIMMRNVARELIAERRDSKPLRLANTFHYMVRKRWYAATEISCLTAPT